MTEARINVRVPADLKKRVDHATVDRSISLTSAVAEAMEAWLGASEGTRAPNSEAISKNHHDPLFGIVERLLQTEQRAHIEALLRWVDSMAHPQQTVLKVPKVVTESQKPIDHSAELAEIAAKGEATARAVLGRTPDPTPPEQFVYPNDQRSNSRPGKRKA